MSGCWPGETHLRGHTDIPAPNCLPSPSSAGRIHFTAQGHAELPPNNHPSLFNSLAIPSDIAKGMTEPEPMEQRPPWPNPRLWEMCGTTS